MSFPYVSERRSSLQAQERDSELRIDLDNACSVVTPAAALVEEPIKEVWVKDEWSVLVEMGT